MTVENGAEKRQTKTGSKDSGRCFMPSTGGSPDVYFSS
jgi:hypothetical protein